MLHHAGFRAPYPPHRTYGTPSHDKIPLKPEKSSVKSSLFIDSVCPTRPVDHGGGTRSGGRRSEGGDGRGQGWQRGFRPHPRVKTFTSFSYVTGLRRTPVKRVARASPRNSESAVTAKTGRRTKRRSSRSFSMNSRPLIFGIQRSEKTKS